MSKFFFPLNWIPHNVVLFESFSKKENNILLQISISLQASIGELIMSNGRMHEWIAKNHK
jgi:hypothetical protein